MLRQIRNMLRWARITKPGANGQQFYTQQMEYLGKVGDGIIVYPFGFHANASADSLALMVAVQGNEDNRAAIPWDAKNRPALEDGEVAFYHPATGKFIIFRKEGRIEGDVKSADLNVDEDVTAEVGGNVTATIGGDMTATVAGNATAEVTGDIAATAGGDITAEAAGSATLKAPTITLDGNVVVTGTTAMQGGASAAAGMEVTGAMTNNGKDIGDTHGHSQGADSDGDTQQNINGVL